MCVQKLSDLVTSEISASMDWVPEADDMELLEKPKSEIIIIHDAFKK